MELKRDNPLEIVPKTTAKNQKYNTVNVSPKGPSKLLYRKNAKPVELECNATQNREKSQIPFIKIQTDVNLRRIRKNRKCGNFISQE